MRIPCLLVVGALAGMAGCGQKGPLVLPDTQHPPHKKLGAPKPAPAPTTAVPSPATAPSAPAPATSTAPAQPGAAAPPQ